MSLDVYLNDELGEEVFWANITHNLGKMAGEAGIYLHLWRPEELGIATAGELVEPLRAGLRLLREDPKRFEAHNPENGWGTYEGLVAFVDDYLAACVKYEDCLVRACR